MQYVSKTEDGSLNLIHGSDTYALCGVYVVMVLLLEKSIILVQKSLVTLKNNNILVKLDHTAFKVVK